MSEVTRIFGAALERTDPAAREAFLNTACAGDPALRRHVEKLLEAYSRARESFEPPAVSGTAGESTRSTHPDTSHVSTHTSGPASEPPFTGEASVEVTSEYSGAASDGLDPLPSISECPGARIGPYKLVARIGEGGMGTVYRAEQETPVRRTVALKIIKAGMDTRQIVARFQAERQALALMDHPNIAKVLDAGATGSGRPYFVMELVMGVPITDYCDQACMTPRERIALLIPVCQAIQHAHQKGIVHRDVKPSNLMVATGDGRPVPKVIDFGIAKAIHQELIEETQFTHFGAIVGTLEYMSPEQAEPGAPDVDTRSDVYSLGVLLYELLTGTTPLGRQTLRHAAYGEVVRRVREEEPPRPSIRVSESGEALASIAKLRQTDPARLSKVIRGELDWIVMKALEKDRTRRYETANGLARDLERYLQDEPVEASPPSPTYRLLKSARKHRVLLATAAAFTALLVAGATVSTWLAVRAIRAERSALEERDAAAAARRRADREAATARAVNEFLQNDLLAQASAMHQSRPDVSPDPNIQVRTLLDRASDRIAGKFPGQPAVEASIRMTIGSTYRRLSLFSPKAQAHLERAIELDRQALGAEHPDTLRAMTELGSYFLFEDRPAEAEPLLARVLDVRRRTLGPEHTDTLFAMLELAVAYGKENKPAQAEPLFIKALEIGRRTLGPEHKHTLSAMADLGWFYKLQNQPAKAEPLLTGALQVRLRTLGPENPATLWNQLQLAGLYRDQGKSAQAEALFVKVLEVSRRTLGAEHKDTIWTITALGGFYRLQGRFEEAERLLAEVLQSHRRTSGADHKNTMSILEQLQMVLVSQAPGAVPTPLASEALIVDVLSEAASRKPDTAVLRYRLALAQLLAGDQAGLRRNCAETLKRCNAASPAGRDGVQVVDLIQLAHACVVAVDPGADIRPALTLAESCAMARRTTRTLYVVGLANYRAGRYEETVRSLNAAIELNPRGVDVPLCWLVLALAHHRLGHDAEAWSRLQQAQGFRPDPAPAPAPKPAGLNPQTTPWPWAEFLILRHEADTRILGDAFPDDPFQRE